MAKHTPEVVWDIYTPSQSLSFAYDSALEARLNPAHPFSWAEARNVFNFIWKNLKWPLRQDRNVSRVAQSLFSLAVHVKRAVGPSLLEEPETEDGIKGGETTYNESPPTGAHRCALLSVKGARPLCCHAVKRSVWILYLFAARPAFSICILYMCVCA